MLLSTEYASAKVKLNVRCGDRHEFAASPDSLARGTLVPKVQAAKHSEPGQSGNPNGRPVGTRQAFSAGFLKDLAEVWQAPGRDSMLHTAKTPPATFFEAPNRMRDLSAA